MAPRNPYRASLSPEMMFRFMPVSLCISLTIFGPLMASLRVDVATALMLCTLDALATIEKSFNTLVRSSIAGCDNLPSAVMRACNRSNDFTSDRTRRS